MKELTLRKKPKITLPVLGQQAVLDTNPTPGTAKKPDWCFNNCPRATIGSGFVPDWVPANPKIAFLFSHPAKDDVGEREPMRSGLGRYFWATIGRACGLKKQDVLFANVLRCYTWKYPTGKDATLAEQACRNWDNYQGGSGVPVAGNSLVAWKPNIFFPTFSLDKMIEIGAFQALAIADVRKALTFADEGFRPLVILGTEAFKVVAPWLDGGVKGWRGTWWEGSWKWEDGVTEEYLKKLGQRKSFAPATFNRPWVRKYKQKTPKKPAKQLTMFEESDGKEA